MNRLVTSAAALLVLCSAGVCYELAHFNLIGFSGDGEYMAWEQWGTYDGSGFPYCRITVMQVPDNTIVQEFSTVIDFYELYPDDGDFTQIEIPEDVPEYYAWEQKARDQANQQAAETLERLGIVPGSTGRLCVHIPLTDLSPREPGVRFTTGMFGPDYPAAPVFELVLENRMVEDLDEETLLMWMVPPVSLYLAIGDTEGQTLIVLVDDSESQDPSNHSYGYSVRDVITWQDSFVVVVLRRSDPGFEGPDTRYRVVTGELPEFPQIWYYSSTG